VTFNSRRGIRDRILKVQEINRMVDITAVPDSPAYIEVLST